MIEQANRAAAERPEPESVRGACPVCHAPVVSECEYLPGRGYVIAWCCWESLPTPERPEPRCDYRRVL